MTVDEVLEDRMTTHEMVVDDAFENGRVARPVPRALGIHDGDRSALANAKAIGLRAKDAALFREAELLQPSLEKVPRGEAALLLTALGVGLIAAEKYVAA